MDKDSFKKIKKAVNGVKHGDSTPKAEAQLAGVSTGTVRRWIYVDNLIKGETPKHNTNAKKAQLANKKISEIHDCLLEKQPEDFQISAKTWTYDAIRQLVEERFSS